MHYPKVWTLNHRRQRAWIFPCWFQPSSLVTCPTLYTYLMPLWLRGPLSHFVAEIIRSGAMENSAWALRLLTGECSICSYQYNSLPSELPLLHSTTNQTVPLAIGMFWGTDHLWSGRSNSLQLVRWFTGGPRVIFPGNFSSHSLPSYTVPSSFNGTPMTIDSLDPKFSVVCLLIEGWN